MPLSTIPQDLNLTPRANKRLNHPHFSTRSPPYLTLHLSYAITGGRSVSQFQQKFRHSNFCTIPASRATCQVPTTCRMSKMRLFERAPLIGRQYGLAGSGPAHFFPAMHNEIVSANSSARQDASVESSPPQVQLPFVKYILALKKKTTIRLESIRTNR